MVQHVVLLAVSVKANVYRYVCMYIRIWYSKLKICSLLRHTSSQGLIVVGCSYIRMYVGTSPTDCAISLLRQVVTSPSLKPPNTALQWLLEYYVLYIYLRSSPSC